MTYTPDKLLPMAFEGSECRTLEIDGHAWWVGRDVCRILGYKDETNAMKLHCKGVVKYHPLITKGGKQNARIINEPDLYRLIGGSKLPAARRFEKWIYEEVIPSVVHTGCYAVSETGLRDKELLDLLDRSKHALRFLTDENMHLRKENRQYEQINRLRDQLAKKNTSLTATEKETILRMKDSLTPKAIADILNRPSDSGIRYFLKTCKEEAKKCHTALLKQ